jgi:hypothetical protein
MSTSKSKRRLELLRITLLGKRDVGKESLMLQAVFPPLKLSLPQLTMSSSS